MYNTKTATINDQEFVSSYMDAGIHDNITLKEVNVKKSPTGKDFLEIIFEDSEGKTATMTEWKNEKNMWIKTDEDLQHRDDLQFGRIMQIINCYTSSAEGEFNTFAEMINWVKQTLDPMISSKKQLRLKTNYDKNNYVRVSTNGIFVEPMDVEKTQIKKFARDNFEKQVVADVETNTSDPFSPSNEAISESGADDLPF